MAAVKFAAKYDTIDGCFPQELIHKIFLQLPVKSLVNVKLVCKSWNSLISSLDFVKSYTRTSNNRPLTLLYDKNLTLLYSLSHRESDNLNPTVLQVNPYFRNDIEVRIDCELIGSCDGLICTYSQLEERIYILNPLTKEIKGISTPYPINPFKLESVSWFGFVPSINDYMIWLVFGTPILTLKIHVYSIRDNKWRELDTSNAFGLIDMKKDIFWGKNAVIKNESLHCWLGNRENNYMVKYDLIQDIIEVLPINLNDNQDFRYNNHPSIGILQDSSLCICKIYNLSNNYNMWVMDAWKLDKYSKSDSWNKLSSLDLGLPQSPVVSLLGFTSNGGILVTSAEKELVLVDPNKDPPVLVRLRTIVDDSTLFDLLDYSESLVSPFSLP
ncbi:F-box/kelch-repeat protein At3g23880-like [Spinacia oleracea]|uniref:F-box/kelch-repeat protein At3g23880-like n=1 Tax=Spinacia oleracea TaxID=3562 RepID=A0ABM3REC1_SPIOL|nr:F-box/kelch-repeat protein At3g23880-like [Spinacia oleracea]